MVAFFDFVFQNIRRYRCWEREGELQESGFEAAEIFEACFDIRAVWDWEKKHCKPENSVRVLMTFIDYEQEADSAPPHSIEVPTSTAFPLKTILAPCTRMKSARAIRMTAIDESR